MSYELASHSRKKRHLWSRIDWTGLSSAITVVTAVGALLFTGLSLRSTRDQVANAQAQNAVAEQGQITERYSKAVEQIGEQGPDHLQVRLGGVYALERLARDSRPDQPMIIEILSAFVRTTSPSRTSGVCTKQSPAPDVQAALTVLGRRDVQFDNHTRIDLSNTCLHAAVFDWHAEDGRASVTGANLAQANLAGADLTAAKLNGVDLNGANLYGANLGGARFVLASLVGTYLERTDLAGADLFGIDCRGATLTDAKLNGTNLQGADLRNADLQGSEHIGANVQATVRNGDTRGAWW